MKKQLYFSLILTGIFAILLTVGAYFHEFWRDESMPWLLVNSSSSIPDLIERLGFIGHTQTWYIFLYILRPIWNDYSILIVTNILFSSLAVFFFVHAAPFTRLQKVLFIFGFFILFQYGVINRFYAAQIMLLMAYLYFRPRLYDRPIIPALCLALLAPLHVFSFIFTVSIVTFEIIIVFIRKPLRTPGMCTWLIAGGILLVSFVLTIIQILPPDGFERTLPLATPPFIFKTFANAFFPNFGIMHHHVIMQTTLGLILWALSWICFMKRPAGRLFYIIMIIPMVAFSLLIYKGYRWHHGFYFIFFLMAIWISEPYKKGDSRLTVNIVTIILAVQALLGIYAFTYDIAKPYSSGRLAAKYITSHEMENLPRVGLKLIQKEFAPSRYRFEIDDIQSTLVYLDDPKIYNPRTQKFDTYWNHYTDPHYFKTSFIGPIMESLSEMRDRMGSDILVIVSRPANTRDTRLPAPFKKIVDLPSGVHYGESISLYVYGQEDGTT